jgi:Rrf2 family iron-sulfur cluster assembly transcriptional regulator
MRLELTKRGDYAIRAVLALARTAPERRSVRQVAADQMIPASFLPLVMGDLVRAGLVDGTVGRRGGYRLAKPATTITLLDVVEAVEGDSRRRVCVLRGGPCALDGVCDVHSAFALAQDDVLRRLGTTSVADAIARTGGEVSSTLGEPPHGRC